MLVTLICAWLENQVCAEWLHESLSFGVSTPPCSPFVPTLSEGFPWLVFHICLPFVPLTWKNPELQVRSFLKELLHSPNLALCVIQRLPAGVKVLVEERTVDEKKGAEREASISLTWQSRDQLPDIAGFCSRAPALQHFLPQALWIPMCPCISPTGTTCRKASCYLFTFGINRAFQAFDKKIILGIPPQSYTCVKPQFSVISVGNTKKIHKLKYHCEVVHFKSSFRKRHFPI